MPLSLLVTPYVDVRQVVPGRYFEELNLRRDLIKRTADLASLRSEAPIIYLVPRFEIHRLLVLDRTLKPMDPAWAPFRASGVALWSVDRMRGYASDLSPAQRVDLEARGYRVTDGPS